MNDAKTNPTRRRHRPRVSAAILFGLTQCACGASHPTLPRPALSFVDLAARVSDPADDVDPSIPGVQRDVRLEVVDDDGSGFRDVAIGIDDAEITRASLTDSAAYARVTFPPPNDAESGDGQHWLWARVENPESRTLAAMAAVEVTPAARTVTAPALRPPATHR